MTSSTILIIDDELSMRQLLSCVLSREKYNVHLASNGLEAMELLHKESFDVILQDMMLPDTDGIHLLSHIKKEYPQSMIVIITAVVGWKNAVEAMRLGAFDYIRKPFDNNNIKSVVARAIKYKHLLESMPKSDDQQSQNIIGNTPQIREIQELIRRASPTDSTIIIYGESGTGKELVARAIHKNSLRRESLFIPLNCGAISETLIESELFGHVKGAFTNAIMDKKGLFEIADNGTLFFDEIGEMPLQTQVKLLRVLEDKEFLPVGGTIAKQSDVRFITATNRNLEEQVRKGEFREDLYYRLNVIPIHIPPLRERKDDIPLLAGYFLAFYAGRLHKHVTQLSDEVMDFLLNYEWHGNVRELGNLIQRAVLMCEGEVITMQDLQEYASQSSARSGMPENLPDSGIDLEARLAEIEKQYIQQALKKTDGNLTNAAKLLKLSFRSIRYKVKKYKIV